MKQGTSYREGGVYFYFVLDKGRRNETSNFFACSRVSAYTNMLFDGRVGWAVGRLGTQTLCRGWMNE